MYSTLAKLLQIKLQVSDERILWTTEWENSTASVILATLKLFLIISDCLQKNSYTLTIHCACRGFSLKRANDTLTSAGFIPAVV